MRISDWSSDVCSSDLIMVQVQSSLFPLYDRNPQKYVPNIFFANKGDYQKATITLMRGGVHPLDPDRLREARSRDRQEIPRFRGARRAALQPVFPVAGDREIGRASCRERGCQYE